MRLTLFQLETTIVDPVRHLTDNDGCLFDVDWNSSQRTAFVGCGSTAERDCLRATIPKLQFYTVRHTPTSPLKLAARY